MALAVGYQEFVDSGELSVRTDADIVRVECGRDVDTEVLEARNGHAQTERDGGELHGVGQKVVGAAEGEVVDNLRLLHAGGIPLARHLGFERLGDAEGE